MKEHKSLKEWAPKMTFARKDSEVCGAIPGGETDCFSILAFGDFDGDGYQDILISKLDVSIGTYRELDLALLSRNEPDGMLSYRSLKKAAEEKKFQNLRVDIDSINKEVPSSKLARTYAKLSNYVKERPYQNTDTKAELLKAFLLGLKGRKHIRFLSGPAARELIEVLTVGRTQDAARADIQAANGWLAENGFVAFRPPLAWHNKFAGRIGDLPIHLELDFRANHLMGTYEYEKYKKRIELNGKNDFDGVFTMYESVNDKIVGEFVWAFEDNDHIGGIWEKLGADRSAEFSAERVP